MNEKINKWIIMINTQTEVKIALIARYQILLNENVVCRSLMTIRDQ